MIINIHFNTKNYLKNNHNHSKNPPSMSPSSFNTKVIDHGSCQRINYGIVTEALRNYMGSSHQRKGEANFEFYKTRKISCLTQNWWNFLFLSKNLFYLFFNYYIWKTKNHLKKMKRKKNSFKPLFRGDICHFLCFIWLWKFNNDNCFI